MKAVKLILKIVLLAFFLLINSSAGTYGQELPEPFDRIKALAVTQGQKNDDGTFMWEKTVENVEYWMVYSPTDESIACGQRTGSGTYSWGIAYGLNGDFQFGEARMGQIINLLAIEKKNAIEIANQFFKELEPVVGNPLELKAKEKWVSI